MFIGQVLVGMLVSTPFQPDPASGNGFAIFALVLYVVLAGVAGLVDRGRAL